MALYLHYIQSISSWRQKLDSSYLENETYTGSTEELGRCPLWVTALVPIWLSCADRLTVRLQWRTSAVQLLCRVVIKEPTTTRRRCCYTTSWNIWHLLTHGCQYAGFLCHLMFLGLGWFPYPKWVPELCLASHLTFRICRIAAPDN